MNKMNIEFPILTLDNRVNYMTQVRKQFSCEGTIGLSVFEKVCPIGALHKPKLTQNRRYQNDKGVWETWPDKYTYGSLAVSAKNEQLYNADHSVKLEHSDANLDSFEKALTAYYVEVARMEKVKGRLSKILNNSISDASISIMSMNGAKEYNEALADPVKMLKLIDETHKPDDDTNKLKALTDAIDCKQSNYIDYPPFVTAFERCCDAIRDQYDPDPVPQTMRLLDTIFKSLLIYNINKVDFLFVIQSVQASKVPMSYNEVSTQLMNFYKNSSPLMLHGNSAVVKKVGKSFDNSSQRNVTPSVEGKCAICKLKTRLKICFATGLPHTSCNGCYKKSRASTKDAKGASAKTDAAASGQKSVTKPPFKSLASSASTVMNVMFEDDEDE